MIAGMSLRVAYVIDDLSVGGAQRQLCLIAPALAPDIRVTVHCLSSIDEPLGPVLRQSGVPVHTYPRIRRWSPGFLSRLAARVRADETHVIHGWLDASNVYAAWVARFTGKPAILSLRSDRLRVRGLRRVILTRELRRARAVTVNSRAGQRMLVEHLRVRAARVVRVLNCIPPRDAIHPSEYATIHSTSRPVLVFVGRLVASKRIDIALAALALVRRNLDAQLVIVGDGPERESLEQFAKAAGVDGAVSFRGMLCDPSPDLERAHCLLLPSRFEGFPNAALEALAHGIPVVARIAGDIEDIVEDGTTGVLVRSDDPAAFARAIERALTDSTLRNTARTLGPDRVFERHALRHVLPEFTRLYRSVYERAGKR